MTQIITNVSGVGEHGQSPFQREPEPPAPQADPGPDPASQPVADAADVRLIIEEGEAAGGFVYTIVDRRTGAVIRQLPSEGLMKLGEAVDYAAGALIKTRA